MSKFKLLATSAFGLEGILKEEIIKLGYRVTSVENGKVVFEGDELAVARSNLNLRTADRVYILMGEFQAMSFDELYDNIKEVPAENYIEKDGTFHIYAKSVKSELFSKSDIQKISKKAMADRLCSVYETTWIDETGPLYPITVSILKNTVQVLLDTSGEALHKRGYRTEGNTAPLRETLAAAIVLLSGYDGKSHFVDPMCGSGTIVIEAALIARNIPPGINRRFLSEKWMGFDKSVYRKAREMGFEGIVELDRKLEGYDIDRRSVRKSIENAKRFGVLDDCHFQVREVNDFSTRHKSGYLVTNPPYGERIGEKKELDKLYNTIENKLINLYNYRVSILTSFEGMKKPDKNRKLYNGKIKTYLYQYFNE